MYFDNIFPFLCNIQWVKEHRTLGQELRGLSTGIFLFSVKLRAVISLQHSLYEVQLDQLTFLYRSILHRQGDEFLVGRQDGPLRLCLLALHLAVELAALGPGPEFLYGHLFKVKTLLKVASEVFQI